ncbi:aminotransferase class III-fold pyridoxal phosphate-dependent enzyme [Ensifer adhaerens]|uniref:aminotransferase class III-fold pyridoxal phosphate-dependent enzyme n=1 Tax=Ensifer adhaerens TaxID=106592 RepID=UPI001CBBF317|nr:aminotransferase class III-fold pyridoxal phosphate-dependent enzyme [Ensifer adhaerens]MBZ7926754.1 aminotransferase class III-fold pyridoxal phosphate-dependent enzyme [Ensifer adhaerens]UAX96924.1 aminotransferase class III-fold pyridoxal phosphate-dependent enzyme [Ensifer adhaerens]UAY03730.1 aminotransferase class III-fold pyridoxal phosphate-dependent enzyme [Ensifer adhaerens]UAY11714.1 aminotransferase class III-fold pyridoxal phosphate-dependent enzyme [Ensifer adhaerens]
MAERDLRTEQELAMIRAWLKETYGIDASLSPLPGEHDLNYRVTATDGGEFLLKLHAAGDADELDMQVAVLEHLAAKSTDLSISRAFRDRSGAVTSGIELRGRRMARLLSWLQGDIWAKAAVRNVASAESLGRLLAGLDRSLEGFVHAGAKRFYAWDIGRADMHRKHVELIDGADKRAAVDAILDHFATTVLPRLATCPVQVIHNDANDYNVLLDNDGMVSGLLDFGDMVETWRVIEVAVASAYALIASDDPVGTIAALAGAYHQVNPLTETEVELVFDLVKTRYAVSMRMAAKQIRDNPENTYLLVSQEDVWRELSRLQCENRVIAIARIRDACGLAPIPHAAEVVRWLERNAHEFAPIVRPSVKKPKVKVFDFSAAGPEAAQWSSLNAAEADARIAAQIGSDGATFGIGLYGEDRGIYQGDAYATAIEGARRSVHLGVDIFAPADEPVSASFAGKVAFIHDDAVAHGFGPTVLLEHDIENGVRFWTLYGHLSRDSIAKLSEGQAIAKGEVFAAFGAADENGNWAPHLHFQVVTDHLGLGGRMHGVGVGDQWEVWREVSPDPSVVLGLSVPVSVIVPRDKAFLVRERHRRIGRSLSIAYSAAPLKIVGGEGAHLIDEEGTRWLDMVNNVCHVGHCHPRVVKAAQTQMQRLNTNSRYLHDSLVEYSRRLAAQFPDPLNVCFFVNSGSEANDLAIRLARAYTGNRDIITVDHAYHGHLSSLIDVSPYKFAGKGGEGQAAHVKVAEMPDLYRGRFRYGDVDAGLKYAEDVRNQVAALAAAGRRPALFFSEGILGTGGQLSLPEGYLREAYAHVRAAGGLCLADEVQVGFGRVGRHMWAHELQGVVPDIVTMGKPIGNGHPMAAVVTTEAIAASFANGMEYFNTFGGNPVSAEIGLAVLDVIRDERLMHHCRVVGDRLMDGARALAQKHAIIGDVRGHGLFNGIELVRDRETQEPAARELDFVIAEMKRKHRILLSSEGPHHNVLKVKPPAPFSAEDCDRFLDALDDTLGRLASR